MVEKEIMTQTTSRPKYGVFCILALLFFFPGIAALIFYTHPGWLNQNALNKGRLVSPAVLLADVQSKSKWQMMVWNLGDCEDVCRSQVEKLARIRLALGRRLYQVDARLLLSAQSKPLPEEFMQQLKNNEIQVTQLSIKEQEKQTNLLKTSPMVFIADPKSYIMLSYELDAPSNDIFHDLGLLLRTADKNNA